jgi:hypothetical protein
MSIRGPANNDCYVKIKETNKRGLYRGHLTQIMSSIQTSFIRRNKGICDVSFDILQWG